MKTLIHTAEGVPVEEQRLIFHHYAELDDDWQLRHYGIVQGSTIHMVRELSEQMGRLVIRLAMQACKRRKLLEQVARLDEEGTSGADD